MARCAPCLFNRRVRDAYAPDQGTFCMSKSMADMRLTHILEIFFLPQHLTVGDDLFLYEVAEGGNPLGLA